MTRFAGLFAATALLLPIAANAEDLPRALIQFADNTVSPSVPSSKPQAMTKQHEAAQQAKNGKSKRSLDATERRETEALNHLQAAGYGNFSNVTPDGRDYRATVMKDGRQMVVRVNPERGSVEAVR